MLDLEPPRSIYIAFDAFPRRKGSSSHIASMVRTLEQCLPPVWLLCLGYGDMPALQVEGGIVIRRFKVYHPNVLRRAAEFADFVAAAVASAGDSVRLLVFRDPFGGAPALSAAPECGAVFEVNALPSWEMPYRYPGFRRNHALRAKIEDMELYCLRESDLVMTVSSVTADALAGLGVREDRIAVVPNSADENFLNARPEDCPIEQLKEGDWIGYVGSLHPWQGIDTLVDGFAMAAPDLPGLRLMVIHNGRKVPVKPLMKRIRKRGVADRVAVRGPLAPAALGPALASFRFTAAPLAETARNTRQGCCPVKIIESMAAGSPVLASDLRVCRELIRHGEDGFLAPPGKPRAWARAIRRLAKDHELTSSLAGAARQKGARDFAAPAVRERMAGLFLQTAGA